MPTVAGTGQICHRLTAGQGPAILVADFQALNGTPRLSRLIADAATGRRVHQVDPRAALAGDRLYATLPDLADEAVALFRSAEPPADNQRVYVVSHCSAAGLSLRIAGRLAETGEVGIVLVQPTWPGQEHLIERFADFQAKLGIEGPALPDLDGDPWAGVVAMERLMRDGLAGLAERHGLGTPPPAFTELLVSYRTWLAFLLACRNDPAGPPLTDRVAVTVMTGEPEFVLPGVAPGRCRIAPPPPTERPDDVTPELARSVLDQISGVSRRTT